MESVRLQEQEVELRVKEENKLAGIAPIYVEKVNFPEGFLDNLLDGDRELSFSTWDLLRKSRSNILSVTLDRLSGVSIERARSSKDVSRMPGQCRDLLYGNKFDCQAAWDNVQRSNSFSIKVDVRLPYPTVIIEVTK